MVDAISGRLDRAGAMMMRMIDGKQERGGRLERRVKGEFLALLG